MPEAAAKVMAATMAVDVTEGTIDEDATGTVGGSAGIQVKDATRREDDKA